MVSFAGFTVIKEQGKKKKNTWKLIEIYTFLGWDKNAFRILKDRSYSDSLIIKLSPKCHKNAIDLNSPLATTFQNSDLTH